MNFENVSWNIFPGQLLFSDQNFVALIFLRDDQRSGVEGN